MKTLLSLLAVAVLASPLSADVKPAAMFCDHAVLQREMKVPIWGTADAGEKVSVEVAGQKQSATADDAGRWRVVFEPLKPADPKTPFAITISGKNKVVVKDVLLGEVWFCSGQSNMAFTLKGASNAKEAVAAADHPTIRYFNVDRIYPEMPAPDTKGQWVPSSPEVAGGFSAVAYFFATELQKKIDQPIGLIQSSWGGTRAEAWIPRETFDALKLPYEPAWTEEWLHPKKKPASTQPERERPYEGPALLWNGMVAPIAGYAMRGVVWYQGETNTAYPVEYQRVLGSLVTSWRTAWGQGDFPFLIVQLPNMKSAVRDWVALRKSQAEVARALPNVGLAVTIDIGNSNNVHPTNKLPVGQRLAAVAQKIAYGKDVSYSGPTFKSLDLADGKAVVSFDHIDGGLMAKGDVQGFEIAGEDGKFVAAEAKIDGEHIVLTAAGVLSPKDVRYGWQNDPKCTLYNKADLPAVPFSTK